MGHISSEVWPSVIKEPIVREADHSSNDVRLRLDLGVRGLHSHDKLILTPRHINTVHERQSLKVQQKSIYQKAVEDR